MALSGEFIANALTIEYENPTSTWNALTTVTNQGKLSASVGEAETTSYGTTARTYIPGLADNSYSFTLMHNNTNAYATRPQTTLRVLFLARTQVNWRVFPNGAGTGNASITFSGFISKMDDDYANDDQAVSSDIEIRINGAIANIVGQSVPPARPDPMCARWSRQADARH